MAVSTAAIRNGALLLDGRRRMSRAFCTPFEWSNVTLEAQFLIGPGKTGVLACGFIVRAQDASTFYHVHFDRTQAILVRSERSISWKELTRTHRQP